MLLFLPVVAFLLLYLIFRKRTADIRVALLASAVFCTAALVIATELLSTANLVTRSGVAIAWLFICILALSWLLLKTSPLRSSIEPRIEPAPWEFGSKVLIAGVAGIVFFVGVTAVLAAPNVWDAMEYHLPRIVMWMSNHNVRFFPTQDYCQLVYGATAEYSMMHAYLLWGSDRFVDLIEVISMAGSIVGVSQIAKMLGASRRGQLLAAVVCATIPEGILEASGPMNTYVVSFWIVCAVVFLLLWNEDPNWLHLTCFGLAVGLALFTKGTAYIYLPAILLGVWWIGRETSRLKILKLLPVVIVCILALNLPQYVRNYKLSGTPLGLPLPVVYPRTDLAIRHITVRRTVSNVLRNASLHMATPLESVNRRIGSAIRFGIRAIGDNPDDPEAIWLGTPFEMNHFSLHEIHAGDPLQFLLFIACVALLFVLHGKNEQKRKLLFYVAGILSAFLMISALLRWQIWSSRYHLPLFVLGAAFCGVVLERAIPRKAGILIAAILLLYAIPFVFLNRTRALLPWSRVTDVYHPRQDLYFTDFHEEIAKANIAAAGVIERLKCNNIGLDSYVSDPQFGHSPMSLYVYPILALIHGGIERNVWYTGVNNISTRYEAGQSHSKPCAVICLECAKVPEKWREYKSVGGRASVFDYIVVFSSEGTAETASKK